MSAVITLKKGEGRLLKSGGAWVYDNEIDSVSGAYENGDLVQVEDFDGYPMGWGFYNPRSKISVRMMSRKKENEITPDFLEKRVRDAWEYRKQTGDTSCCRVIFGEADWLPGLVVDASMVAVEQARENAALNGLEHRVRFVCEDVFTLLPRLEKEGEVYDLVILDPPAFAKSRSALKNAVKGYREINLRGMRLVKDGGFLATCSCSHFLDAALFTKTLQEAARGARKRLRQVECRTQAPDHPILWAAQESWYLKFYLFQVCEER